MSLESAEQLGEVRDLIARVFSPADLEMFVHDRLGVPLANLVGPGPHLHRVFELLQACEARGWLDRLLDGVAAERQQNPDVALLMQRLGRPAISSIAGGVAIAGIGARSVSAVGTAPPDVAAHPLSKRRDAELQSLVEQLDDAYARQKQLQELREPVAEIEREILDLKRRLRGDGGHLRVGDRLGGDGRYQLLEQVGRGGFAVVWKAKDRREDIYVAIKVLHANLSGDSHRRERFLRGARIMQRLDHPAIVRVLDPHCEDGGFWYFVMEFVPNGTLHDAVLQRRLVGNDALLQVIRVGEALAIAHAQGIVHRDIKPQNILLDDKLAAKLTDFDLVGAGDTTGGTRTSTMGTVIYAAPECLEKPQEATARADVFGLGMTAVFVLAGKALTLSTLRNPEPTIAGLDLSGDVKEVLRRAVAWEPQQRFTDAAALVDALSDALSEAEAVSEVLTLPPEEASKVVAEIRAVGRRGADSVVSELAELEKTGPIATVRIEDDEVLSAEELRDAWPLLELDERCDGLRVLQREDAEDFFVDLSAADKFAVLLYFRPGLRRQWMRLLEPDHIVDVIDEAGDEHRSTLLHMLNAPTRREVAALLASADNDATTASGSRGAELPAETNAMPLAAAHSASAYAHVAIGASRPHATGGPTEQFEPATAENVPGEPRREILRISTDPGGTVGLATAASVTAMTAPRGYAKLVVVSSNLAGKEFELSQRQITLGRANDNDIVINHRSINRDHARLVLDPETRRYMIVGLHSSSDVRINGVDYGEVELRSGDVIDLGRVRLRFIDAGEDFVFARDALITDVPKARGWRRLVALVTTIVGVSSVFVWLRVNVQRGASGGAVIPNADQRVVERTQEVASSRAVPLAAPYDAAALTVAPAGPSAPRAPGTSPTHPATATFPDSTSPEPPPIIDIEPRKQWCEKMNVVDMMAQASHQYAAGLAKAALQLIIEALECEQDARMYRMAATYACAAQDASTAKLYAAKVSPEDAPNIAMECMLNGIKLP